VKHKIVINGSYGGFYITDEMWAYMKSRGITENDDPYFNRHHPILVEAVENCKDTAELRIVEIDTCMYYIDEYDGLESVMTPKNISWTVIDTPDCKEKHPEYFV
jgi:hypothetical protein